LKLLFYFPFYIQAKNRKKTNNCLHTVFPNTQSRIPVSNQQHKDYTREIQVSD
jgi:hypothetical protein